MGATDFYTRAKGATAKEAFQRAREDALHQEGHGGYTGSIAEKTEFVMIAVPEGKDPREFAQGMVSLEDSRINDKWGPAGCVPLGGDEWYFFGIASE